MANQVVWFDMPVADLDRAIRFYSAVLNCKVEKQEMGMPMGVLPHEGDDVAGCLTLAEEPPTGTGPLLYFNVSGRLDDAIAQVGPNGGTIVHPRHSIGPYGFRAVVRDSEGNRIALHSM